MLWLEIVFALLIAFVIAAIFVPLLGWRHPGAREEEGWGAAFLFLFLILFLATWAGGAWLSPYGPAIWGVPWLGFLLFGIFVALLIAAVVPPARRLDPSAPEAPGGPDSEPPMLIGLGVFFWILLILLIFAIVGAYAAGGRL